jgi:hypothetical protein
MKSVQLAALSGGLEVLGCMVVLIVPLALGGCVSLSSSNPPPPSNTTVVVPQGTTVVCPNGTSPPC